MKREGKIENMHFASGFVPIPPKIISLAYQTLYTIGIRDMSKREMGGGESNRKLNKKIQNRKSKANGAC